jgi:hypothetical protein
VGTISRWMPPAPEPTWTGKSVGVVVGVLVCLLVMIYFVPMLGILVAGIALVSTILGIANNRRLRRLAAERQREDIGTFARSFDRRASDPWVIRAVWDAFVPYVSFPGGRLPLRASDCLDEDLRIDPDDVDILVREILARVGRTPEALERNPLTGRVRTIGDVVAFVNHQPKRLNGRDDG